jgi:hypothetical protein
MRRAAHLRQREHAMAVLDLAVRVGSRIRARFLRATSFVRGAQLQGRRRQDRHVMTAAPTPRPRS